MMAWFNARKGESTVEPLAWACNVLWGGNRFASQPFQMPGLRGYLLSVPCRGSTAGGDIHYITVCGYGIFSKFLIIDIAGHGDIAANLSQRLKRPLMNLMQEMDNVAILNELNQDIIELDIAGNFATVAAATYNHWDRTWIYAYAGHPYMLVQSTGRWEALYQDGKGTIPVGIMGDAHYYQNTVRLKEDEWILLFTDAVLDLNTVDGGRLGIKGLINILNTVDEKDVSRFYLTLIGTLVHAHGNEEFSDDLTLILLKHSTLPDRFIPRTWMRMVQQVRLLMMTRTKIRRAS